MPTLIEAQTATQIVSSSSTASSTSKKTESREENLVLGILIGSILARRNAPKTDTFTPSQNASSGPEWGSPRPYPKPRPAMMPCFGHSGYNRPQHPPLPWRPAVPYGNPHPGAVSYPPVPPKMVNYQREMAENYTPVRKSPFESAYYNPANNLLTAIAPPDIQGGYNPQLNRGPAGWSYHPAY